MTIVSIRYVYSRCDGLHFCSCRRASLSPSFSLLLFGSMFDRYALCLPRQARHCRAAHYIHCNSRVIHYMHLRGNRVFVSVAQSLQTRKRKSANVIERERNLIAARCESAAACVALLPPSPYIHAIASRYMFMFACCMCVCVACVPLVQPLFAFAIIIQLYFYFARTCLDDNCRRLHPPKRGLLQCLVLRTKTRYCA